MAKLSSFKLVNIVIALIMTVLFASWAAYNFIRDGTPIIRNGYIVGYSFVDPVAKLFPVIACIILIAFIAIVALWPNEDSVS